MKRYYTEVVVRPMVTVDMFGPREMQVKVHVTADCELDARRKVLQVAWNQQYWVTRFNKIRVRELQ